MNKAAFYFYLLKKEDRSYKKLTTNLKDITSKVLSSLLIDIDYGMI